MRNSKGIKTKFNSCCQYLSIIILALLYVETIEAKTAITRDPTKPLASFTQSANEKKPLFVVQSIMLLPTKRMALINDKLVKVGDYVNSSQVLSINKNAVVLSVPEGDLTVYFIDHRSILFSS